MRKHLLITVLLMIVLLCAGWAAVATPTTTINSTIAPAGTTATAPITSAPFEGAPATSLGAARMATPSPTARSGTFVMCTLENSSTARPAIGNESAPAQSATRDYSSICKGPVTSADGPSSRVGATICLDITASTATDSIQMTSIIDNEIVNTRPTARFAAHGETYALLPANNEAHISDGLVLMHF